MGRFIAGEACEEREKMRSSRVTTVLRGMDGSLRITIRNNTDRSLKLSNPRTMFHTGHSSCKYCVSNAKIWFSSLFSVSFRLLVHQPHTSTVHFVSATSIFSWSLSDSYPFSSMLYSILVP